MNEENQVYFIDSDQLPPSALERKHRLEQDPSFRADHMKYMDGMQVIESDIKDKVLKAMGEYVTCCSTVSGADGKKSRRDNKKSFWKYCLYFYTTLYSQLLSELLHLLWIQLL